MRMMSMLKHIFFCFFSALTLTAAGNETPDDVQWPADLPPNSPRLTPTVAAVYQVLPCVVNIATENVVRVADSFEQFFNEFSADRCVIINNGDRWAAASSLTDTGWC